MVPLLGVALPFDLIAYGIQEAVAQDRDLRSARTVTATVVSSQIGEARGRRGVKKHQPVIVFRYEVGGRVYESDASMLYAARGRPDGVSVEQFVGAHPPGARVQAYYVPGEPWRGFLLDEYNDSAYVAIYIGLGVLAIFFGSGLGYAFYPAGGSSAPRAEPGWLPLAVPRPLRARVGVNLVQAAVYLPIWGWAAWHYLSRVPGPHGVVEHLVTWGMGLPGLWYLVAAARAHYTRRAASDARVAVRNEGLHPGGQVEVRVEQEFNGDAVPERVRVGLVCEETTGRGKNRATRVHWETWATPWPPPAAARPARDGHRIAFTGMLPLPADQPPTNGVGDPRYAWKLVVETALVKCPDYRETFDLHVPPTGSR